MKKNRCLKIASGLLLLVLVTTCAIGTTLAKYTTQGDSQDSARVAKWGVKLQMQGDSMFLNEYDKGDTGVTVVSKSVTSGDSEKIVAPGTKSSDGTTGSSTAARFSISGTPEVAVKIEIGFTTYKDIFLKAGTYSDPTGADSTFNFDDDYYPVVFTLNQVANADGDYADPILIASGNLATIAAKLEAYSGTIYEPGTDLTATFELSWEWVFESGNDKADTYLGNLIAGSNPDSLTSGTDYSTQVSYNLTITVTQVD